jgi:hypothetical protein
LSLECIKGQRMRTFKHTHTPNLKTRKTNKKGEPGYFVNAFENRQTANTYIHKNTEDLVQQTLEIFYSVPGGHERQAVAAVVGLYLPEGQLLHTDKPVTFAYLPPGHAMPLCTAVAPGQ